MILRPLRHIAFFAFALGMAASAAGAQPLPPSPEALEKQVAAARKSGAPAALAGAPRAARSAAGPQLFSRKQGNEIGIDHIDHLTPNHFFPPFWNGRGLAGGDVDRDGFQDLLVASEGGVRLFLNRQGLIFTEQPLDYPGKETLGVHAAALVDVDDDGWLDIFFTTFAGGNYFLSSDEGRFPAENLTKANGSPKVLTLSVGFGDLDEDGDLDAVLGNWYFGYAKQEPATEAANKLLFFEDGNYRVEALDEILGDTLSVLLSDLDLDGHLDVIIGNDFQPPDVYYRGDGRGGLRKITRADGLIPATTDTTMSIDTGDIDNDLLPDIYLVQIASAGTGQAAHVQRRPFRRYCEELNRAEDKKRCEASVAQSFFFKYGSLHQPSNITKCRQIPDKETRAQCAALMIQLTAIQSNEPSLCDKMPATQEEARFICKNYFRPSVPGTEEQYTEAIEILMNENILLDLQPDGTYRNVAKEMGVTISAWGWNARFLDFDNDEWQDLYVINGTWMTDRGTPPKFAFRNLEGRRFEDVTDAVGLQNYMLQSSYVKMDVDNDGDLDLFVGTTHGPIWFYRNNEVSHHSIQFALRDEVGNHFCIGCRVTIRYGEAGERAQMREIKASGGFLSFDPPEAHFGLGGHDRISAVEVVWSTGEETHIQGELPANALYTISRPATDQPRDGSTPKVAPRKAQ